MASVGKSLLARMSNAKTASVYRRNGWGQLGITCNVLLILLFCLLPLAFALITSLKRPIDLFAPGRLIFRPTIANYVAAFGRYRVGFYLLNSLWVATLSSLCSLLISAPASYGFSRLGGSSFNRYASALLTVRMLPPICLFIPFMLIGQVLRLCDTYTLLTLVYLTFCVPFSILMMKGFFDAIPYELEEAAMIDGATRLGAFRRVVLPLCKPGLFATGVMTFIFCWNEFTYAFFLTTFRARTLPTAVVFFIGEVGVAWGEVAAIMVLACIPVIIFGFLAQKSLIKGLTFGAVK